MFKDIIYIEKSIRHKSATKSIIEKIQPKVIVLIEHYKEVLNQTNSHWLFNKSFQKLILAKRESEFYYRGAHLTSDFNQLRFYYNTLALNCLYHCEYCYLQGMYNTPHLVLFLNNHDFIKATKQLIRQTKQKIFLALSYDTDLPVLEKYYPYCQEWIEFANKERNITIEIRTKSNQLDFLKNVNPSDNVILSFTLSPERIQKQYEPLTPSLEQRISAVQKTLSLGFRSMLCFDPLFYFADYKQIYSSFIDYIFEKIPPSQVAASIGAFRMNSDFFKRIKKHNPSDIYLYPYQTHNNAVSYPQTIRQEMITFVQSQLKNKGIKDIFVYE